MEEKQIARVWETEDEGMGFDVNCTMNDHLNIITGFVSAAVVRMFDMEISAKQSADLLEACVKNGLDDGIAKIESKNKDKKKELEEAIIEIVKKAMED